MSSTSQAPCPECSAAQSLQPLSLPKTAAMPMQAWQPAPLVAKCSHCKESFSAPDLIRKMVKQRWPEGNLDELKEKVLSSPHGIA